MNIFAGFDDENVPSRLPIDDEDADDNELAVTLDAVCERVTRRTASIIFIATEKGAVAEIRPPVATVNTE